MRSYPNKQSSRLAQTIYPDPVSVKEARKTTVSGGVYSLVAYLPVRHEVLSFIPKTAKIGHGDPYL